MRKTIITFLLTVLCLSSTFAQKSINDTFWRDVNTGDWILGITPDAIIYDCKVWDITSKTEKKDAYTINAQNEGNSISIGIGKEKNAQRVIAIGKKKIVCDAITTPIIIDYPTKDDNPVIADNNYQDGDSVTIVGWLRNMTPQAKEMGEEFTVAYANLLTDGDMQFSAKLDAEGRFCLRFPIYNTLTIFAERGRAPVIIPVEPNQTYFIYKDFTDNRCYIMGENSRLQNESLMAIITRAFNFEHGNYQKAKEYGGFEENRVHLDGLKDAAMAQMEQYCNEHPTLSERFKTYFRNEIYTEIGSSMLQVRFGIPCNFTIPDDYLDYVTQNYWNKIEEPRTMNSNFETFFHDYFDCIQRNVLSKVDNHLRWGFYEGEKDGIVNFTAEDKKLMNDYVAGLKDFETRLHAAPEADSQAMIDAYNASDIIKQVNALVGRKDVNEGLNQELNLMSYKLMRHATDSLGWNPALYDFYATQELYSLINGSRQPLRQYSLDFADANIKNNSAKKLLHDLQDQYVAITNKTLSKDNLKSSDDVEGLTEGEQILRKLLEPYRGHYVLVDFWGVWCSPCKEALTHSQEEYERLKPYDMVFMYLANRSDDAGWRNVIKQYDVTGENVVHYNLPVPQQTAIEKYLKVNKFPSYFLFDKEGNLVPVNADPRDLDAFAQMMKRMKE